MTRNLRLLAAMMFVLGSAPLAAETVVKPFNGTNLDGWKFNGNNENCWNTGRIVATATTFELAPMPTAGQGGQGNNQGGRSGRFAPALANMVPIDWNKPNPFKDVDKEKEVEWNKANPRKGVDIYTEEKFGDCTVKLEFLITKGSNSGVYLMGEYEVQIADSFAKPPRRGLTQGDMGAIYSATAPSLNASGVPGTWQTYEIEFVAPKFDANGNRTAKAKFNKVILNGVLVQENVEVEGSTGGGVTGKEHPTGPLMLQGNHGPVAFRNIEIIVP